MGDGLDLRDEDRLPWLETVEPDEEQGAPIGKTIALVAIAASPSPLTLSPPGSSGLTL